MYKYLYADIARRHAGYDSCYNARDPTRNNDLKL